MKELTWLEVLRDEINKPGKSQNKVAKELGFSSSMISQVLRGKYPGSIENLKLKVEGRYMNLTVSCPVKGEIPVDECREHQSRPFSSANRERVKLYRSCRSGCPHSSLPATAKSQRIDIKVTAGDEVYNLENQVAFLKRAAGGDSLKLNELLEKELTKLATRYNQLLWSKKYSRSEK